MPVEKNISLKSFNTFGVDVNAKYFATVNSVDELVELLNSQQFMNERKLFLGGGSNILFTKFFDGIVIKQASNAISLIEETTDSVSIRVDAGREWDELVKYAVNKKYYGIENLSFVPGSVGASPIQNIGAYGAEVKDVVERVNVLFLDDLSEKSFSNLECKFGYRDSIFKNLLIDKCIITSVDFKLSKKKNLNLSYQPLLEIFGNKKENFISINEVRDAVISIRKNKLPDPKELGNGGSFFKNPIISSHQFENLKTKYPNLKGYRINDSEIKISAGWLIEESGLKGFSIDNVGVHKKQALVIVNYGGASGLEILEFSNLVGNKVKEKFGINLIKEINIY